MAVMQRNKTNPRSAAKQFARINKRKFQKRSTQELLNQPHPFLDRWVKRVNAFFSGRVRLSSIQRQNEMAFENGQKYTQKQ